MDQQQIVETVQWLVDDWCEVRKLNPLRHILSAYPLKTEDADQWNRLRGALEDIRVSCGAELMPNEVETLAGLIPAVERLSRPA